MFHAETMKPSDFYFAVNLANTMSWNMADQDFEFMLRLEPQGCFVLFDGSKRVGISTCISYGKVGWFGNLIVKENYRRKGAGSILLKHSIEYLKSKNVETIGLYAYPSLVRFYEKLGFNFDAEFAVLKGQAVNSTGIEVSRLASIDDIPAIISLDSLCFGADRKKLLKPLLSETNNLCYVSTDERGIVGYAIAKVYNEMAEIGPLVCKETFSNNAMLLIRTILSKLKRLDVSIYLPRKEATVLAWLLDAGFHEDFQLARMLSGRPVANNCIYLAESLERG